MTWIERELFGGALSCDIMHSWRDVSDVRQVPDHQECWQELEGALLVVEILERQDVSDSDAAAFFFGDLAEYNEAKKADTSFGAQLLSIPDLPENVNVCSGIGCQKVALGRTFDVAGNRREQDVKRIRVELCVFRLENVKTDLLVTMSSPLSSSEPNQSPGDFSETFRRIVSSLKIRDWSLFGSDT